MTDVDGTDNDDVARLIAPTEFGRHVPLSWSSYAEAIKLLDGLWRERQPRGRSFSVLGTRPSWEDTIARGQHLFETGSWAELDAETISLIAPTVYLADGDALLGSIGRRSKDVRFFLFDPNAAPDRNRILRILHDVRSLSRESIPVMGGDILVEMCRVRGVGKGLATRLLTLARPDGFVVVNNASREWLSRATGLPLTGKKRSYNDLLKWVHDQPWAHSPHPRDDVEKRIAANRVAFLDAFAYEP